MSQEDKMSGLTDSEGRPKTWFDEPDYSSMSAEELSRQVRVLADRQSSLISQLAEAAGDGDDGLVQVLHDALAEVSGTLSALARRAGIAAMTEVAARELAGA